MGKLESTKLMPAASAPAKPRPALWLFFILALGSPLLIGAPLVRPLSPYEKKILTENPLAHGFTGEGFRQALEPPPGEPSASAPFAALTLGIQQAAHGDQAWAFRLVNLILHLATALLLFHIVANMLPRSCSSSPAADSLNSDAPFGRPGTIAAMLAAAFFYYHPAQVEVVGSVAGRGAVQGLFLAALAWWLVAKPAREPLDLRPLLPPSVLRYSLALAAYLAALLSEPAVLGLAPLFIMLELLWTQGDWSGRVARLCGFAFLALGMLSLAFEHGGTRLPPAAHEGVLSWPLTVFCLVGQHLAHALAPWSWGAPGAAPFAATGLGEGWVWATAGVLAGLVLFLFALPVNARALAVLLPAALLTLFFSLAVGTQLLPGAAGHLYVTLGVGAPLFGLSAEALNYRFRFLGLQRGQLVQRAGLAAVVLFCAVLAFLSLQRSLHEDAASETPAANAS